MVIELKNNKIVQMGLILSFALILSYVECLIPFSFGIPGIKLGLANFAILMVLYFWGVKEAALISMLRIIISAFLFGNVSMMIYAMAGGMFSLIIMFSMKELRVFSPVGVSMGGGVFHNIGQILVAFWVTATKGLIYYLPILMLAGLLTGTCIGLLYLTIEKRMMLIVNRGGTE